jgi:DNA-binding transcriptional regulator YiaG
MTDEANKPLTDEDRIRAGEQVSDLTRANYIKRIRANLDLTRPEFWEPMGINFAVGGKYEAGMRKVPDRIMKLVELTYVKVRSTEDLSVSERNLLVFLRKNPEISAALKYIMQLREDVVSLEERLRKATPPSDLD